MDVRVGNNIMPRQKLVQGPKRTGFGRVNSCSQLPGVIGISKRAELAGTQLRPLEEFGFFTSSLRHGVRRKRIMGTGVVMLNAQQDGDALFSGRISKPDLSRSPRGDEASRANFYLHPETVAILQDGEDNTDVTTIGLRGVGQLVGSRLFSLETIDVETDDTVYQLAREQQLGVQRQPLGLVIRMA